MKYFRFAALLLVFGLAGCSRTNIPGCKFGDAVVGETYIQYGTFRDTLAVVVWSDITAKGGISASTTFGVAVGSDKAEYKGTRESSDGRAIKWQAVTKDGKTGTVTINDKDYRLEDGAIFLVRTNDGPTRVIQVKHDLTGMKPAAEMWEQLGKQNPEIKKFMDQVSSKKG